jgi:hypothetical protein
VYPDEAYFSLNGHNANVGSRSTLFEDEFPET